jgi:uncharacterized protein YkwD
LGAVARQRSEEIAASGSLTHYDANGNPVFILLLDAYQVPFMQAGENLAWNNYGDDATAWVAVEGWKHSPPHADIMFNGGFSRAGIGVVSRDDGSKIFTLILVAD